MHVHVHLAAGDKGPRHAAPARWLPARGLQPGGTRPGQAEGLRGGPAGGVPPVFVVGAMAHGKLEVTYVDKWVSVSEFPLSAACCLGRITNAFEDKWDIV